MMMKFFQELPQAIYFNEDSRSKGVLARTVIEEMYVIQISFIVTCHTIPERMTLSTIRTETRKR